jgi:hypothetical protein
MIQVSCLVCRAPFLTHKSLLAAGKGKYCSKACFLAKTKRISRACAGCGAPMSVRAARANAGQGVFCSRACQYPKSAEERFWQYVDKSGPVPPHTPDLGGCWVWTAAKNDCGYGLFNLNGESTTTHRVAWLIAEGNIPKGAHVLHRCDNRACVRLSHLFLGDHATNMADMRIKGRGRGKSQDGEMHAMHKLTSEQVLEIRKLVASGVAQVELAPMFSVHKATVNDIVLRKTWRHL